MSVSENKERNENEEIVGEDGVERVVFEEMPNEDASNEGPADSQQPHDMLGEDSGKAMSDTEGDPDVEVLSTEKQSGEVLLLESMINAKNEALEQLASTEQALAESHDKYVRTMAEFENFKKRQQREKEDALKYANEKIVKALLPVLDNLDRAVSAAEDDGNEDRPGSQTLKTGVEMVLSQMNDVFGQFGIEVFSAVGERFDPNLHEAVARQPSDVIEKDFVIEMYQKGATLNGRLVRPALVIVSSGQG